MLFRVCSLLLGLIVLSARPSLQGEWRVHMDRETGYPQLLHGAVDVESDAPSDRFAEVRSYLAQAGGLLGIPVAELVDDRVLFLPLGLAGGVDKTVVRFRQVLHGVPVRGGFVSALFHSDGRLLCLEATGLPNLSDFETRPDVPSEAAVRFALERFRLETGLFGKQRASTRLVVAQVRASGERLPALVWEVEVVHDDGVSRPEAYAYDVAAKGEMRVVARRDLVHSFDVGGTVTALTTPGLLPDSPANPPLAEAMRFMTVTAAGIGSTTTDENGSFLLPGVAGPVDVTFAFEGPYNDVENLSGVDFSFTTSLTGVGNAVLLNPGSTEQTTAQANAFARLDQSRDFIVRTNPFDTTADFVAVSKVNWNISCAGFFDGSSTSYSLGGFCPNAAYSTVIAHEQGHWYNVLYGSGNGADGFGEGNADVWAMYAYDTPFIGSDFLGPGTPIRSGLNTRAYCGDGNGGCYGQTHSDGEVLMGALWKVRANLNATLGDTTGDLVADALFLGWMNAFDQATIDSVIETQWLLLDDDDGDLGNGTPNYADIDAGFVAQGFPGVALDFMRFENAIEPQTTPDENGPYGIAIDIVPLASSSIQEASVVYRVDGGAFTELSMENFAGDTWTALLPGIPSPATVELYVEGRDPLGNQATFPEGAPAGLRSFQVGAQQVFFSDDFENLDDNGWTHSAAAGTDDWERGAPLGASGSAGGTSWTDPAAAYSGLQAWGTDLSVEGAYASNVADSALVSPAIDLSSAVGATLVFRRWLTVDAGISDQARISVDATQVFLNPTGSPTLDAAWQRVSIDISAQGDGVADATIEWSLSSDSSDQFGGWAIDDVEVVTLDPTPSIGQPVNYGTGLAGTNGIPAIDSAGQPATVGNAAFEIAIKSGLENGTAFVGRGFSSLSKSIFGGTLLVLPDKITTINLDLFGQGTMPLPIPADPTLVGLDVFFQSFVIDPVAPSGFAMTDGLQATIVN